MPIRNGPAPRFSPIDSGHARSDVSSSIYSGGKAREPFYKQGAIVIPAISAAPSVYSPVVQFVVPYGRNGYLWKIGIDYVGGGFQEGQGNIVYTVFRNAALSRSIKGLVGLTASIGSVNNPVEIPAVQIYENETISIAVTNVAIPPAGQQLVGVLVGFTYPRSKEGDSNWP